MLVVGGLVPRPAEAVRLSDSGGQVAIFPYYTVNGGLNTLLRIANGSGDSKALKVYFREGSVGREVLRLNVYLPPYATWAAAITDDPSGFPRLASVTGGCSFSEMLVWNPAPGTGDLSYTLRPAEGLLFSSLLYTSIFDDEYAGPARAREGMVEVIEMGVVEGELGEAVASSDCTALFEALSDGGAWRPWPNQNTGIRAPGGQLTGSAMLVNVAQGVMYSYRATLIDGFSGIPQHTGPRDSWPTLASAAGANDEAPVMAHWRDTDGTRRKAQWPRERAIDAVSAVLTQTEVRNSFAVDAALGASTEWVLTFPTRHFYTDNDDFTLNNPPLRGPVQPPFAASRPAYPGYLAHEPWASVDGRPARGARCFSVPLDLWSRTGETMQPIATGCFVPFDFCGVFFATTCHVTQVLAMGAPASLTQESAMLGSKRQMPSSYRAELDRTIIAPAATLDSPIIPSDRSAGQARVRLVSWPVGLPDSEDLEVLPGGRLRPSLEGIVPEGLPVIAISFERYTNSQVVPGVLANYATAVPHVGRVETVEVED